MGRSQGDYRRNRYHVAVAAHFRNSGGVMGGGKKIKAKKNRRDTRQSIRKGEW